jgi:hypothetical protein
MVRDNFPGCGGKIERAVQQLGLLIGDIRNRARDAFHSAPLVITTLGPDGSWDGLLQ